MASNKTAKNTAASDPTYSFEKDLTEEQRGDLKTSIQEYRKHHDAVEGAINRASVEVAPAAWNAGLEVKAIGEILKPQRLFVKGLKEIFPQSTACVYRYLSLVEAFGDEKTFLAKVKEVGSLKAVYPIAAEKKRVANGNAEKRSGGRKEKPTPGTREHLSWGLKSVTKDVAALQANIAGWSDEEKDELRTSIRPILSLAKELGFADLDGRSTTELDKLTFPTEPIAAPALA